MSLNIANNIGYCFGVKRAMEFAINLAKEKGKNIYTIGDIIHNKNSIEYLTSLGIMVTSEEELLNDTSKFKNSFLIIRAHGINKDFNNFLIKKSNEGFLTLFDYTCPYVKQIHNYLKDNTNENTLTLLLGKSTHPEIIGTVSYIKGSYAILADFNEFFEYYKTIQSVNNCIILVSQTTADAHEYQKILSFLKQKNINFKFCNSICPTTINRQNEIYELSKNSDYVYIIGDKKSSNTTKLFNIANLNCKNTYLIESISDLEFVPNIDNSCITIASGASAPDELIKKVIHFFENA